MDEQKALVAHIAGILIGGLLVWTFTGDGSCGEYAPEDANYKITTSEGTYFVESYTKEHNGTCVYIAEKELRYCGDYTVKKVNEEE